MLKTLDHYNIAPKLTPDSPLRTWALYILLLVHVVITSNVSAYLAFDNSEPQFSVLRTIMK
ncbi:hypothetical protein PoB_007376500 [Plakobranchus ocellatus]|uniref:Uncharacterized protein n=1 Tax=Plakobranchus ocellatus TaxID=259542 RepID=A0AAV4DSY4_9GAST|nr:hypothetical protein PoB_007376500 [Plakobranchus ocellatus]